MTCLNSIQRALLAACAGTACASLHAQLLDNVDLQAEGTAAVVHIHFVSPVRLQRWVVTDDRRQIQINYSVLPTAVSLNLIPSDRSVSGLPGLPSIQLSDNDFLNDAINRQLIIRLSDAAKFRIRPGISQDEIELVLDGLGASVAALNGPVVSAPVPVPTPGPVPDLASTPASPAPTAPPSRTVAAPAPGAAAPASPPLVPPAVTSHPAYAVRLQAATLPGQSLEASIPSEFQNQDVYTAQRIVDGKTIYEIFLGDFATRAEAERARAKLTQRFPQASVAEPTPVAQAAKEIPATSASVPPLPAPVVTPLPTAIPAGTNPAIARAPSLNGQPVSAAAMVEYEERAKDLLKAGEQAYKDRNYRAAIDLLNQVLNLPETSSSRRAHQVIGLARMASGDPQGARKEFKLFLDLYPVGADSDQVRSEMASLPAESTVARQRKGPAPIDSTSGSVSLYYYGGQSQTRSQQFQNSALNGLPVLLSDSTIAGTDIQQAQATVDLNWRHRDDQRDMRIVFRDAYTDDMLNLSTQPAQRLTAAYFDMRDFTNDTNLRIGRQSPTGQGVLYRFDGVQAGYMFAPQWRINAVAGMPSDTVLNTQQRFAGVSVEALSSSSGVSGDLYLIKQTTDSESDRSAIGTDLRYFRNGLSVFGQVDYDTLFQRYNIQSVQGTRIYSDNSVLNFLVDRRTIPVLSLSTALFYQDPTVSQLATTITQLLQGTNMDTLIAQVKGITPYQNQALIGYTTPLSASWQTGGSVNYTSIDAIDPVPVILPDGQPATGNIWSYSWQLIGSNLYSKRDTDVFNITYLSAPTYTGYLASLNNITGFGEGWQVEPSLRYYTQTDNTNTVTNRYTPGLRVTYRFRKHFTLESNVQYEVTNITGPTTIEDTNRIFYYFGTRYDF